MTKENSLNFYKYMTLNLSTEDIEKITGKTFEELFEDRMKRENKVKVYGYYGIRWEPQEVYDRI